MKVKAFVTQLCPAPCNPMDHSPSGSSVHAVLQARTLEWVAISFSISFSIYSTANTKYDFVWIATNCEKFLKRWEYLTCLLRNLYAGQEGTVRTGHGTTDWFQIGKGVHQGCILSPCLFNLYAGYIMKNAGWKKHKLESRLPGEISITSDMQMTPPLWQKLKN